MNSYLDRLITLGITIAPDIIVRRVMNSYHHHPEIQDRLRYHVKPFRRTSPIPNRFELDYGFPDKEENPLVNLPSLPEGEDKYYELLNELNTYGNELSDFPDQEPASGGFFFHNSWYDDVDAAILYAMVRKFKPTKVVEVGCGYSTLIIAYALERNTGEGSPGRLICIDPEPRLDIKPFTPEWINHPVQNLSLDMFGDLSENDILFIDSTHVLKMQNDVLFLLSGVLPVLAPGVLVHFHDIFLPYDYPPEFSLETCHMNEQYALSCVLANTPFWEVLLPVYYMFRNCPGCFSVIYPEKIRRPSAFWMRRKSEC